MAPKERRAHTLEHNEQDPLDAIHPDGGLVDVWVMDDQTIVCDPKLANAVVDPVDHTCQHPKPGGVRNRIKTHAIIYATDE